MDDRTWRVFDVWESREDFDRFLNERLMPAMKDLPTAQGAAPPTTDTTYELHGYQGA